MNNDYDETPFDDETVEDPEEISDEEALDNDFDETEETY